MTTKAPICTTYEHKIKNKMTLLRTQKVVTGSTLKITYEGAVPFCSDLRNGVNCRKPQSERNRRVTFR